MVAYHLSLSNIFHIFYEIFFEMIDDFFIIERDALYLEFGKRLIDVIHVYCLCFYHKHDHIVTYLVIGVS